MKIYSVSEKQKKNSEITEADFESEYLESINNPKKFWKEKAEDGSTQSSIGFVAQEVEEIYPTLVTKPADDTDAEQGNKTKYKTLNYPVMVSILTKAIQELEARIVALENK